MRELVIGTSQQLPTALERQCTLATDLLDHGLTRAAEWVLATQRPDGAWGRWEGTAEETAYAVQILVAVGRRQPGAAEEDSVCLFVPVGEQCASVLHPCETRGRCARFQHPGFVRLELRVRAAWVVAGNVDCAALQQKPKHSESVRQDRLQGPA